MIYQFFILIYAIIMFLLAKSDDASCVL